MTSLEKSSRDVVDSYDRMKSDTSAKLSKPDEVGVGNGRGRDANDKYALSAEYPSEDVEQMQSNPSTDSYDDYEDDDIAGDEADDDYENEYENESEDRVVDDDDDDDDEEPEALPEAKSLVQTARAASAVADDEEEDMGYDEDDERYAIAVERPRVHQEDAKGYVNEEGSGNYGRNHYNRFRLDSSPSYRQKHTHASKQKTSEVDLRESSGNFANDDEDDNDDDESDEDDGTFFNSKITSNNRYFRKNTNDAIHIISTPLGKVGIVYQPSATGPGGDDDKRQPDNADASGSSSGSSSNSKKTTTLTDFDALSPDPASSHRLASSHPKITPVLTPDGKVALLYRGDSESSKYEPIRNLTHKYNNNKSSGLGESNSDSKNSTANADGLSNESKDSDSSYTENEDDLKLDTEHLHRKEQPTDGDTTALQVPQFSDVVPTKGSFIIRPTDSVLPMINRPLSEVLGIKKNQFKQIRVKDTPTTTTSTEGVPSHLLPVNPGEHSDSTTLRFLTKVNLADYPTSTRSRIFDFDFSRDNTMLDERSRQRELQQQQQQQQQQAKQAGAGGGGSNNAMNSEQKLSTIASDEILSKTEVVNLAIIPHFDEELERLQRLRDEELRRHHRKRHRHKQNDEELSGIHCIMQAMMGIAAISTVFGMLGTFFKQRILDQIRLMHW